MNRINLQSLADRLGLARSTVSRALRDDPLIAEATRLRVKRAAEEIGYSANPYLSVLMSRLREGGAPAGSPVLAFINPYRSREGWRESKPMLVALRGVAQRAGELGFDLQEFWLGEPGMSAARLRDVLHSRGIRALILGAPGHPSEVIAFETDGFATVAIDLDPLHAHLHRATPDYLGNSLAALRSMRDLGYRRVGLAIDRRTLEYMYSFPRMAFLEFEESLPRADRTGYWVEPLENVAAFARWLIDAKPDAIVTAGLGPQMWLPSLGFRVPADIGLAQLFPDFSNQPISGIDGRFEVVGRNAVDLLVARIHRNEFRPPSDPIHVTNAGVWVSGSTTLDRRQHPPTDPYDELRQSLCRAVAEGDRAQVHALQVRVGEQLFSAGFDLPRRKGGTFVPLALTGAANTAFHTPVMPPRFPTKFLVARASGAQVIRGIDWTLPPSAMSGPATVITLNAHDERSGMVEPAHPRQVPVGFHLGAAYFLQLAFFVWNADSAGHYAFIYEDGSRHSVDLHPFWNGVIRPHAGVFQDAWQALPQFESSRAKPVHVGYEHDPRRDGGFFYVYEFRNPRPGVAVRAIELCANPRSSTKVLVAGITALRVAAG